ncbi:MAG: lipocalin family protein [Chitinophagales bacterium]
MKKLLFLLCLVTMGVTALAARKNDTQNPIVGSWKFSRQSKQNEFRKVMNNNAHEDYKTEYFIFEGDNKFRHEFVNEKGTVVKVLKGKWKTTGDKIKIEYADIDYNLTISYFFLDNDLVLGQNFNHVIFSKDNADNQNYALK